MEKYQEMKKFIAAALEYSRHHADSSSSALQRHLQILASTTDINEFDPNSSVATEFYVSLHELMAGLESRSMLVWSAIAVLQKACTNSNAKKALIHTYKFIPILTRFLGTHHITDKQLRLLQVLVELTYGVKISWQEAHLPYLISTLVQIVLEGDKELKPYALGVLVNLCYKNLPALYVLMRKVEITKFIKCITRLNDCPNIKMQVCKMLIILEQMKGVLPDTDILNFVDVTFSTVTAAFESRDIFLLRHIVDFFKDVKENEHFCSVMLKYTNYYNDTKKLVELVEVQEADDDCSLECVSLLLDFFPALLSMDVDGMCKLFPRLTSACLRWVQNEATSIQSLAVIQSIVEQAKGASKTEIRDNVIETIKTGLPALLLILDTGGEEPPSSLEKRQRLTGLVTLLSEMSGYPDLRKEILMNVKYKVVGGIFEAIIKQEPIEQENLFKSDVSELCIQTLTLVSALATFNSDWMTLYVKLLTQRNVQVALAVSLYSGNKKIKAQVFSLTSSPGWTKDCTHLLSDVMCEIKPVAFGPSSPVLHQAQTQHSLQELLPLYNCAQESRLNELIAALQEARENGKIGDASTSAVMELYEYKLAAMGHAERRLQCSLEAADATCTGMNHQIAQYRAEVARLHQMLFYSQQCIEGTAIEKKDLMNKLSEMSTRLANEKKTQNAEIKELKKRVADLELIGREKDVEVQRLTGEINARITKENYMSSEIQQKSFELERVQTQLQESLNKNQELIKVAMALEERFNKNKSYITELETRANDLSAENREVRQSLHELMQMQEHKDAIIADKEKIILDYNKRVEELERIREIVINVAGGKKTGDRQ
ncbi:UNVERIFIED_CONTAM: hypothetical protein PYX00_009509 [Menopon gallinae]|uniref:CIP2A N-terminal domain-containing protein n=1 Tax=Menopon gallinae TaxID=328185 RepID=A0AAW2HC87_9NEOP